MGWALRGDSEKGGGHCVVMRRSEKGGAEDADDPLKSKIVRDKICAGGA